MYTLLEYLPLLVLGLLVLSTRASHEKNMRLLSRAEQERLYRDFTRYRLMQYGAIFAIIGVSLPVLQGSLECAAGWGLLATSAGLLILYVTVGYGHLRRKLLEIEMPEAFVSAYLKDRYMIALLLGILIAQGVRRMLGY